MSHLVLYHKTENNAIPIKWYCTIIYCLIHYFRNEWFQTVISSKSIIANIEFSSSFPQRSFGGNDIFWIPSWKKARKNPETAVVSGFSEPISFSVRNVGCGEGIWTTWPSGYEPDELPDCSTPRYIHFTFKVLCYYT